MKKILFIVLFLLSSISAFSQTKVGTISLKDSSGTLVIGGAIKTNTVVNPLWILPRNISPTVAGLGLSLSNTSGGLMVNVGSGLKIVNDTLITDNSRLFSLDTNKLGYKSKPNIWTGINTWTSSNIFYGITYFGNIETNQISSGSIYAHGNINIDGQYLVNGIPISGGVVVDTSLFMHKNGGTQTVTTATTFNSNLTVGSGNYLIADDIEATIINVSSGIIQTNDLTVTGTADLQGLTIATNIKTIKGYSTPVEVFGDNFDWNEGINFYKIIGNGTPTYTFSNVTDGQGIDIYITHTGTTGNITWPTVSWEGGIAPVQTLNNKTDIYHFEKRGTTIFGSFKQNMTP